MNDDLFNDWHLGEDQVWRRKQLLTKEHDTICEYCGDCLDCNPQHICPKCNYCSWKCDHEEETETL